MGIDTPTRGIENIQRGVTRSVRIWNGRTTISTAGPLLTSAEAARPGRSLASTTATSATSKPNPS